MKLDLRITQLYIHIWVKRYSDWLLLDIGRGVFGGPPSSEQSIRLNRTACKDDRRDLISENRFHNSVVVWFDFASDSMVCAPPPPPPSLNRFLLLCYKCGYGMCVVFFFLLFLHFICDVYNKVVFTFHCGSNSLIVFHIGQFFGKIRRKRWLGKTMLWLLVCCSTQWIFSSAKRWFG